MSKFDFYIQDESDSKAATKESRELLGKEICGSRRPANA